MSTIQLVETTMDATAVRPSNRGLVQRRHHHQEEFSSSSPRPPHLQQEEEKGEEDEDIERFDDDDNKKYDVATWTKADPQLYRRKSKSIRRFYKQQNALIDRLRSFYRLVPTSTDEAEEETQLDNNNNNDGDLGQEEDPDPAAVTRAINASFALNVFLLAIKIFASILSGSMSVIASTADSLLDLLSGSVLVITHRLVKKKDTFRYPQGKSRLEPIGVFSFAIIMMLSSLQILIEAVRRLISRPEISLGPVTLGILLLTIATKALAAWYCRRVAESYTSGAAAAYADDHRNDVLTNCVGVGAAVAAVYVPSLWFLDSTGAIGIALYIIFNWLQTGFEQMHFLTGRGASPLLLQQLTYIASHHDERIKFVDTVRAFHFGVSFLVEIDLVLPEDMPLRESHDIAESLQHRLEQLDGACISLLVVSVSLDYGSSFCVTCYILMMMKKYHRRRGARLCSQRFRMGAFSRGVSRN